MNDPSYIDPRIAIPATLLLWLIWGVLKLRDRKLERDSRHDRDRSNAGRGVLTQRTEHGSANDGVQHGEADSRRDDREREDKPESSISDHLRMLSARGAR